MSYFDDVYEHRMLRHEINVEYTRKKTPFWTTAQGEELEVNEIKTSHLKNIKRVLESRIAANSGGMVQLLSAKINVINEEIKRREK
jgi:hypothetical protein